MNTILALLGALSVVACVSGQRVEPQPYVGWLPPHTHVDLSGTFAFSPTGELSLILAEPCTVRHTSVPGVTDISSYRAVPCDRGYLRMIQVVAMTPWHSQVPGEWIDAGHLVFRIDWKNTDLDPFDDDAATLAAQPWAISGSLWVPSDTEARRILRLASEATDAEIPRGAAPNLEVTRFAVDDGFLRAGGESTLTVRIANRGPGMAYRVIATTGSGIASLHGRGLRFGRMKPGTEKTQKLQLTVPISETLPNTMLVLELSERNRVWPRNITSRVQIAAAKTSSMLAVNCSIRGGSTPRIALDAGEDVVLHCLVDNSGTDVANVELETSVAGAAPLQSAAKRVAPAGHASFVVSITIPRELAIDSAVEITIAAYDHHLARTARTTLVGVIRKPKLCVAGLLTRPQYRAKLARLRADVASSALTQAQFDRYEAELVACLE